MPTCGLCTAKKHKAYILCDSCTDKPRICMQCWALMLFMCPIERSCTKLHLLCPYCKQIIENIDRLKKSSYYTEQTIKLLTHQLQNIHRQRDAPYRVWERAVSQESIFSDDSEWFSKSIFQKYFSKVFFKSISRNQVWRKISQKISQKYLENIFEKVYFEKVYFDIHRLISTIFFLYVLLGPLYNAPCCCVKWKEDVVLCDAETSRVNLLQRIRDVPLRFSVEKISHGAQKYLKENILNYSIYFFTTDDSIAVFLKTWYTYLFIHPQSHVYSIFCHLLLFKLTHFPLSVPSRDIYGETHWLNPFDSAHAHDSSQHSWQSYQTSIGFPPCSKQNKAVFHLCLIPLSFLVLAGIDAIDNCVSFILFTLYTKNIKTYAEFKSSIDIFQTHINNCS